MLQSTQLVMRNRSRLEFQSRSWTVEETCLRTEEALICGAVEDHVDLNLGRRVSRPESLLVLPAIPDL
jgi:hypothetical protein